MPSAGYCLGGPLERAVRAPPATCGAMHCMPQRRGSHLLTRRRGGGSTAARRGSAAARSAGGFALCSGRGCLAHVRRARAQGHRRLRGAGGQDARRQAVRAQPRHGCLLRRRDAGHAADRRRRAARRHPGAGPAARPAAGAAAPCQRRQPPPGIRVRPRVVGSAVVRRGAGHADAVSAGLRGCAGAPQGRLRGAAPCDVQGCPADVTYSTCGDTRPMVPAPGQPGVPFCNQQGKGKGVGPSAALRSLD